MAFRIFRFVVGAAVSALAVYMVYGAAAALTGGAMAEGAAGMVLPVMKIVGALVVLATYYYALWSASGIRRNIENIFAIPELLKKLAFTLALLCIYRIGFHVPLPGLDQGKLASWVEGGKGTFGQALEYFSMFTGGSLQQSTLFGLGIMPYISASIIFQLLVTVVPALERLQKEGAAGHKKIQEYTRYATVVLCIVQAVFWMNLMRQGNLLYDVYKGSTLIFLMGVIGLTGGTIFLMWLGEQIDEYGIGNGISLLIMAGIVVRLPGAVMDLVKEGTLAIGATGGRIGPEKIIFIIACFIFIVAGAILITQGQRRIPIQQAKHTRGRRVYGGQRQYLPLRVNHGGVMPIIFASSLMIFPNVVFGWLTRTFTENEFLRTLHDAFGQGSFAYVLCYVGLIFFFAYFWTTVQFRPKEMAQNLRDQGHFIPGLRPGKRTADYLERVMERITYCGAGFLAAIATIPMIIQSQMGIPYRIAAFLGGTGLLITVSVTLDLVQRIEANLVMRNYPGFLGGSTRIKGSRS